MVQIRILRFLFVVIPPLLFFYYFLAADLKCGGVVCDTNANCSQASSGELQQCVCNPGWTGNGQTCLGIETLFFLQHFPIQLALSSSIM